MNPVIATGNASSADDVILLIAFDQEGNQAMKTLRYHISALSTAALVASLSVPISGMAQIGAHFDDTTGLLHLPTVSAGDLGQFDVRLKLTNQDPITFALDD